MTSSSNSSLATVSLVVISKDRREDLGRLLQTLAELDYPAELLELVLVEEADTPFPMTLPPQVIYVQIPRENKGYGYARNIALEHCRHEIVAFTDDDCLVSSQWLRALVAPFADSKVAGVAGAVLPQKASPVGVAEIVLGFPGGGLKRLHEAAGRRVPIRHLSTCNCAYRLSVLRELGGFALQGGSEDYELADRATRRYACVFEPEALVFHRERGSLAAVFRWFKGRGAQQIAMIQNIQRDQRSRIAWNLRTSILLRAMVLLILLLVTDSLWLLPWGLLGYYGVMLFRYRFARKYLAQDAPWLAVPLVKLVMDVAFDLGKLGSALPLLWMRR